MKITRRHFIKSGVLSFIALQITGCSDDKTPHEVTTTVLTEEDTTDENSDYPFLTVDNTSITIDNKIIII